MAKRANPYVEDFIPQSKVHYGEKQFNNNEDRLKKVYEKTLKLLFKGAKKQLASDAVLSQEIPCKNKKDHMKQLIIGKNGVLERTGIYIPGKMVCDECTCGKQEGSCSYCEVKLCGCRKHICASCNSCFCSRCSLYGCDGTEICVSCYK